jgi:hypothetical protein
MPGRIVHFALMDDSTLDNDVTTEDHHPTSQAGPALGKVVPWENPCIATLIICMVSDHSSKPLHLHHHHHNNNNNNNS